MGKGSLAIVCRRAPPLRDGGWGAHPMAAKAGGFLSFSLASPLPGVANPFTAQRID